MKHLSHALPAVGAFALAAVLFLSACASGPANIPEDLAPAELIQQAQEALDRNRYNVALQYYQVLMERNITNIDLVCEAEYEIAMIRYKQKRYDQAIDRFNALLERYNSPDGDYLPPKFRVLSYKVLERVIEKKKSQWVIFYW